MFSINNFGFGFINRINNVWTKIIFLEKMKIVLKKIQCQEIIYTFIYFKKTSAIF